MASIRNNYSSMEQRFALVYTVEVKKMFPKSFSFHHSVREQLNGNGKMFQNGTVRSCSGSAFCALNRQLFGKKGLHMYMYNVHVGQCSSPLRRLRSLACLSCFSHACTHIFRNKMETVNAILVIKIETYFYFY